MSAHADLKKPDIFVAGIPATGKSYFGEWLAKNHGYLHIDFEKQGDLLWERYRKGLYYWVERSLAKPLIDQLKAEGKPLYFNWGFPLSSLQIDMAGQLTKNLLPIWFHAETSLARSAFEKQEGIPVRLFDNQVADIARHGFALDTLFGANTIESLRGDIGYLKPEDIFNKILSFSAFER